MTDRTPFLSVLGPNGSDLVKIAGARLIGVQLIDRIDDVSDEAIIRFTNKPPYVATPALNTPFTVLLGWSADKAAKVGQYTFQRVHFSGNPREGEVLEWICRAADFSGGTLKDAASQHFDKDTGHKTLADVFRTLFGGQQVMIDPKVAEIPIPNGYKLQWQQSAIDFATDLAHENGLIIKEANGTIVVLQRGSGLSASGAPLTAVNVVKDQAYEYDVELEPRFEYKSVSSTWFDTEKGRLEKTDQLTGFKDKSSGIDALPHVAAAKDEAERHAAARARDWGNYSGTGMFIVPGDPTAVALAPVRCFGFPPAVDNVSWEAVTVTNDVIPDRGWTTTIETQVKVEAADDPLDSGTDQGSQGSILT